MSYDPKSWDGTGYMPTLYSKHATEAVGIWMVWVEGPDVCVRWGQLDGTMQDSRHTCLPKNEGRSNATTAEQQAIKEAISKWTKQLKKKYSMELETAGKTNRIKPMLALDMKKRTTPPTYPACAQPKLDGIRCLAFLKNGGIYLQSRGGDPIFLDHIKLDLANAHAFDRGYSDFVLDGELYCHGLSLQEIISLVKRPRPESECLLYCVYDTFCHRLGQAEWSERWGWLATWFTDRYGELKKTWQVPSIYVRDDREMRALHAQFVADGYEGLILRMMSGAYYEDYRSPDLIKLKEWEDAEFVIVGHTIGKGKAVNMPIFTCLTPGGKEFEVVPKGSAEFRAELLRRANELKGTLMKVQYLDLTQEGKPRCARGIALRDKGDLS